MDMTETTLALWERWWVRTKHRSPVTMRNYKICIRPLLESGMLDDAVPKSAKSQVPARVTLWVTEPEGVESRRFRARVVRAFCKWASSDAGIGADYGWWSMVELPDVLPYTVQPTVQSIDAKAAMLRAGNVRDRAIVAVLWSTGVRVSELCRMQIEDLFLDQGMMQIPKPSKRGAPHLADLDDAAVKALVRMLRHDKRTEGPLWIGKKGPLTTSGVGQMLQRIEAKPPHAWRRGCATELKRNGVGDNAVMSALGWSSNAMVRRYTAESGNELAIAEIKQARA